MPSQNRMDETSTQPPSHPPPLEEEKGNDSFKGSENHSQEQAEKERDSEGSPFSTDGETDEFIVVNLAEIRKEVQCPICLGIIRKTRTVMECLHRFCRECIDKSMRLGNNECPACRTHCASRRSLRDDPNYDALIAALYPDIDKYEEEELALHEEEKARNKQFQASFAQTFRRQTEASGKKRRSARGNNLRNSRGRRNYRVLEQHGFDDEEEANDRDGSDDSSSADERSAEIRSKVFKRCGRTRASQSLSGGVNVDGGCDDNDSEARELLCASLGWGRGRRRSNNRRSGLSWASGKFLRSRRLAKLMNSLQCPSKDDETLKITVTLVSLQEEKIPRLKRPYLCCNPASSVRHLCQYVAMQTSVEAGAIEILMVKNYDPVSMSPSFTTEVVIINPCNNQLQLLNEHQTLEDIHASFTQQNLVLAYRPK